MLPLQGPTTELAGVCNVPPRLRLELKESLAEEGAEVSMNKVVKY